MDRNNKIIVFVILLLIFLGSASLIIIQLTKSNISSTGNINTSENPSENELIDEIYQAVINKNSDTYRKYIDEVLEVVKLTEWKDRQASKFSLGMKQRLGIAQALISKPELLILDEPTNGLDPSGIHEIRGLIKELPKLYNMTVIISSHNLSEIELIADDIGIINRGKMLFQGTLEELHSKSKSEICIESKDLKKIKDTLDNCGYKYKVKDKDIFLKPEGRELDEILKQLILSGNKVFKFVEVQKSLEEIFLDLTEGGENI